MAGNSILKQFLLDILAAVGEAFAAWGVAATSDLEQVRQASWNAAPHALLSPTQAAIAVVKNTDAKMDFEHEARLSGIDSERWKVIVEETGNPPGPETLLDMWNRGEIDGDAVARGLRQGYLKDEWITHYLGQRHRVLPGAEVVQAAIQNQATDEVARNLWQQAGEDPNLYDIAFNTAGNPPGPTETLTMLDRGIFDLEQATQALKESRLKDKYIPQFLQLARRRIPFRTLNTLVKNKAISVEYALQQLEQLGYTESDAQALIKSAETVSATGHHVITEAQVVALYEARRLSNAEAVANLEALGYTADAAAEVLQLGDVRALLKLRDQVVSALRTRYVGHRIDEATVRSDLAAAGVPGDQQDQLLTLWTIEQTANPRELTEAQLRQIANAGLINVGDYTSRLVAMGYTTDDAALLTRLHFPPKTA